MPAKKKITKKITRGLTMKQAVKKVIKLAKAGKTAKKRAGKTVTKKLANGNIMKMGGRSKDSLKAVGKGVTVYDVPGACKEGTETSEQPYAKDCADKPPFTGSVVATPVVETSESSIAPPSSACGSCE